MGRNNWVNCCDSISQQHRRPRGKTPLSGIAFAWRCCVGYDNCSRLTLDQRWNQAHDAKLDGTNNVAERAIGWWIKERYRTMRTYKRLQSVRNVTNLITCLAASPQQDILERLIAA